MAGNKSGLPNAISTVRHRMEHYLCPNYFGSYHHTVALSHLGISTIRTMGPASTSRKKIMNFGYKILEIEENLNNRFNFYGVCFDIIDTISCFICNKLPGNAHTLVGPSPNCVKKKKHHINHLCNYRLHRKTRPRNHCNRGCYREPRAYKQQKKHKTLFPKYGINVSFLSILPVTTYFHRQRQRKLPRVKQKRSNKHKRKKSKMKQEEKDHTNPSTATTFTDWFKNASFYLKFKNIIRLSCQKLSHWKWYCAIRHHINSNFIQICFCLLKIYASIFLVVAIIFSIWSIRVTKRMVGYISIRIGIFLLPAHDLRSVYSSIQVSAKSRSVYAAIQAPEGGSEGRSEGTKSGGTTYSIED